MFFNSTYVHNEAVRRSGIQIVKIPIAFPYPDLDFLILLRMPWLTDTVLVESAESYI